MVPLSMVWVPQTGICLGSFGAVWGTKFYYFTNFASKNWDWKPKKTGGLAL